MTSRTPATGIAPALTQEQREDALRKATAVRVARRSFKDAISRGERSLASAIAVAKADDGLAGIRVSDLLMSLPGIGPRRAEALMEEIGIAHGRRIRGLSRAQVESLVRRVMS